MEDRAWMVSAEGGGRRHRSCGDGMILVMSVVSALHELGFDRKVIETLRSKAKVRGESPAEYLQHDSFAVVECVESY